MRVATVLVASWLATAALFAQQGEERDGQDASASEPKGGGLDRRLRQLNEEELRRKARLDAQNREREERLDGLREKKEQQEAEANLRFEEESKRRERVRWIALGLILAACLWAVVSRVRGGRSGEGEAT